MKILRIFKNKLKNLELCWVLTSPSRYIYFLRKQGVKIGDNILFHWKLKSVSFDLTRLSIISIGSGISFNNNLSILTQDWETYIIRNQYKEFIPSSVC